MIASSPVQTAVGSSDVSPLPLDCRPCSAPATHPSGVTSPPLSHRCSSRRTRPLRPYNPDSPTAAAAARLQRGGRRTQPHRQLGFQPDGSRARAMNATALLLLPRSTPSRNNAPLPHISVGECDTYQQCLPCRRVVSPRLAPREAVSSQLAALGACGMALRPWPAGSRSRLSLDVMAAAGVGRPPVGWRKLRSAWRCCVDGPPAGAAQAGPSVRGRTS